MGWKRFALFACIAILLGFELGATPEDEIITLFDCDGDGCPDCYLGGRVVSYCGNCVFLRRGTQADRWLKPVDCHTYISGPCRYDQAHVCGMAVSETIQFGDYTLKLVDTIKCVSVHGRPYTSMIVSRPGADSWLHFQQVLVDSGADISVLPISVARVLGIDLSGCQTQTYHGVGGGTVLGYLSEVQIGITHLGGIDTDVDGYILADDAGLYLPVIPVAFISGEAQYILGREDAFDLLDLDFTADSVTIRIPD